MTRKHHGLMPFKGIDHLCNFVSFRSGRFARLFTDLPPLYINPLVLHDIGKENGVMQEGNAASSTENIPAGLIFFGQFIDHDITLDVTSSLTSVNNPQDIRNVRTPTLDLDSVYGNGPEAQPHLYEEDTGKLLTGADYASGLPDDLNDLRKYDLPRTPKGVAIIGDPRNDENRVIAQIQLGFLRFHNTVMDMVAGKPKPLSGSQLFEEVQRIVTWHYQWIVVNEFVRSICGNWIVDDILANGRKVYRPECLSENISKEPFIPIEFATAAFRFGHTMIPQKLNLKPGGPQHDLFGDVLGNNGFGPLTDSEGIVEWGALLDSGDGQFKRATQVDTKLAKVLLNLPFLPPGVPAFERSLAVRNLLRAQSFLIPSGEQIAKAMVTAGANEITIDMIDDVRAAGKELGLPKATPFWLYILAEGQVVGRMDADYYGKGKSFAIGEGLGPVGARFVAEVLIGLLELDSQSFLGSQRNWSPHDSADKIGDEGITTLYQLMTASLV